MASRGLMIASRVANRLTKWIIDGLKVPPIEVSNFTFDLVFSPAITTETGRLSPGKRPVSNVVSRHSGTTDRLLTRHRHSHPFFRIEEVVQAFGTLCEIDFHALHTPIEGITPRAVVG